MSLSYHIKSYCGFEVVLLVVFLVCNFDWSKNFKSI